MQALKPAGFCYPHAVQALKPAGFCYSHGVQALKPAGFCYPHAVQARKALGAPAKFAVDIGSPRVSPPSIFVPTKKTIHKQGLNEASWHYPST